jgi:uncharacterized protein with HEPN domain
MNRSDLERLRDAREFARYAQGDAGGLSAEVLANARQPRHAALYDLIVIGETLGQISAEVKSVGPDIEWRKIANLRNIIVHSYWQVDLELIADVIRDRLDPLVLDLTS